MIVSFRVEKRKRGHNSPGKCPRPRPLCRNEQRERSSRLWRPPVPTDGGLLDGDAVPRIVSFWNWSESAKEALFALALARPLGGESLFAHRMANSVLLLPVDSISARQYRSTSIEFC